MNSRHLHCLWLTFFVLSLTPGRAHQGSTSYLSFLVAGERLLGRWEIPVNDLDTALKLDTNNDHQVSAEELRAHYTEVQSYALRYLRLSLDGSASALTVTNTTPSVRTFPDGDSLSLDFVVTNKTGVPKILEVDYRFMFEVKPLDRAFMQVEYAGITQTAVFTPEQTKHLFNLEKPKSSAQFLSFGRHGVWHIWIGFDHILFLVALLLPSVLVYQQKKWQPVSGFREAFINVFKVVTAFTVAHSLTLTLAALEIVTLPSRPVEAAIAVSVLVAALNNIRPFYHGPVWTVAFAFGLIHGFGFANVLTELGLPRSALVLALVGFNLGVEVGQLAIVCVFLPLAFGVRRSRIYQRVILILGSAFIAVMASLWLVERVFDTKIL